jgi:hypothetical protein
MPVLRAKPPRGAEQQRHESRLAQSKAGKLPEKVAVLQSSLVGCVVKEQE